MAVIFVYGGIWLGYTKEELNFLLSLWPKDAEAKEGARRAFRCIALDYAQFEMEWNRERRKLQRKMGYKEPEGGNSGDEEGI